MTGFKVLLNKNSKAAGIELQLLTVTTNLSRFFSFLMVPTNIPLNSWVLIGYY
jgi:hypothetical protein